MKLLVGPTDWAKGSKLRRSRLGFGLVFAISAFAVAMPASADDIGHEAARRLVEKGRIIALSKVLDRVLRKVPGKLLGTELEYDDGILVYEIKILRPGGRVQELEVDAATGRILEIEDDD